MADEELGRAIIKIGADDAELDRSISNAETKAKGFAQSLAESLSTALTTAIAGAVAAAGAALAGLAVTGVNAFAGFQEQMNSVFTLLPGISQQAMQQMGEQVKDFAVEFGALPEKVIPALYEALSSGVPKDNVFSFLETAQKAAIGGVTDTQTTVDGLTSVVNAYGADVLSVQDASDQMFTAVAYGKTTFAELASTLYNVNPIAASLGVSFSDVSAAIAAMTSQGVPTAQTTTMLRQLFVELSQSGGEVSDLFQQLSGTSFKSFIESGGNVQQALQLLEQHANASGVGINDLFSSVEAGSAALTLTGRGTEMFTGALDAMQNSAGATEAAYTQMDQGLARAFDGIRAQFAVLQTNIGNALAPTVQAFADWLAEAMPRISAVVVGAFERIGAAVQMVGPYFLDFASTASEAFGLFIDLASSAVQWGSNIATQLANGIMGGAGAVVDSLGYIGDLITYWLEPHSPPKLLPNIDTWGRDTAQVWMDGWNDARLPTDGLLAYLETELKSIEDAQQRVKEAAQEQQLLALINSTGGKDSDREQAKLELAALKLRQKIREEQAKAAEQETKKPKASGGGGGGGKSPMDDAAKNAEAAARAQWEYTFSIAGTVDRLQMLKDKQAAYATTDAEYWRLQGQINQEEQKRQAELNKLAKEQRDYELSLMSTEDQLARLRQEQGQYAEGSAEYNDIQQEINKAEKQRQRELEEVKRKQDEAAKAERDYQYATADTAGKLAILQGELANTNADQSEYWRIKTQILQLEAQQQKELEASAEKMKGVGGAAKGAAKGVGALVPPFTKVKDGADETNQSMQDAATGAEAAADRYADLKDRQVEMATATAPVPSLIDRIRNAFSQAAPFIESVKGAFMGIAALFTGMGLVSLFSGLAGAVAALVSPMGLLVAGAAALGLAWQTNFATIRTITTEVFTSIQSMVQTAWGIITSWFRENGEQIVTFLRNAWGRIEGIVSTVLGAVGTVIQTALGAIRTFLEQHGEEIKGVLTMAWETIQVVIDGALDVINGAIIPFFHGIATFLSDHKDQITGLLSGAWSIIKGIVEAAMSVIQGVIKTVSAVIQGDWSGAWTAIKDVFAGLWNGIIDIVKGALEVVWNLLVVAWDLIGTGISTAWDGISDYFRTMFGGVLDNLDGFLEQFKNGVAVAWQWIKDASAAVWDEITNGIVEAFRGILSGIKSPLNLMITAVNKLIEGANTVGSALGFGGIPLIPYLADGVKNWAGGLAFASEPWKGIEAMRTRGGDFALLPPGISNIPRGAEVFTAEETKGMAARMVVPQGGMVGTLSNALPTNQPSAPSIINQITIDARQATNPAAIKAAVEEVWNKKMKDILGSANILLKTNPYGK
ncbi:phage tail tape measure protein, TP901 family [Herpetosiphon aurantiacus DSM 785]|uniref:Phage tail tape measure protein, TP901 family n=1 Tax=Herpetosiphon aurantiacus (strain ATCC 23779 / DSM 785 / 114-95) TaxID=316274 RepID=A9B2G9_HERA2|nr:phage tail tape measure protein, TP901 family [Herpetosiphon aurantiacus DSM 785]